MSLGIYSGSLAASYMNRITESKTSSFIAGRVTVRTIPSNMFFDGLSPVGLKALAMSPNAFHSTCGNIFATSVIYGADFIFMLEVSSQSRTQAEAVRADLDAHVGVFGSASARFTESMSAISSKYSLSGKVVRNGLNEDLPDQTPQALQAYALAFPKKVTDNEGKAMAPVEFGAREYVTVDPKAPTFGRAEIALDTLLAKYIAAHASFAELKGWSDNPDDYLGLSVDDSNRLTAAMKTAEQIMIQAKERVEELSTAPLEAAVQPVTELEPYSLPARLVWVELSVGEGETFLGVVPPGETRRVKFRGSWSPSGGTTWWEPANGHWWVDITGTDGVVRSFPSPTDVVAKSGESVSVHLFDQPGNYGDNVKSPSDPACAALY